MLRAITTLSITLFHSEVICFIHLILKYADHLKYFNEITFILFCIQGNASIFFVNFRIIYLFWIYTQTLQSQWIFFEMQCSLRYILFRTWSIKSSAQLWHYFYIFLYQFSQGKIITRLNILIIFCDCSLDFIDFSTCSLNLLLIDNAWLSTI